MGYDLSVDAAAAAAATAADARSTAAAAVAATSLQEQQRLLLLHVAQAAVSGQAWVARAAALTAQLKLLARGQGAPDAAVAAAAAAQATAGPPTPALSNPDVAAVVDTARAHLAQLQGLMVNAEHESEALSEVSKAYCLCQCLYDEIRPMLGCDYCSDWFHWECVGLPPPREGQDPTEVAPPDFRCVM